MFKELALKKQEQASPEQRILKALAVDESVSMDFESILTDENLKIKLKIPTKFGIQYDLFKQISAEAEKKLKENGIKYDIDKNRRSVFVYQ